MWPVAERLDTRSIDEMPVMNSMVRLLRSPRSRPAPSDPRHPSPESEHGVTPTRSGRCGADNDDDDRQGYDSLTFVYPMYDEEALLERAVNAAIEVGNDLVASGELNRFDILIVDDASIDATGPLADAVAAAQPLVSVVHHRTRRRLSGALRTGLAEADGAVVLYTDADMPFDMAETTKALRIMRLYEADVVSAYRFDRSGDRRLRRIRSSLEDRLVQVIFGLRLRDMAFGFKLVRRPVLETLDLQHRRSLNRIELLVRSHREGFRIVQFGVDYFPRARRGPVRPAGAALAEGTPTGAQHRPSTTANGEMTQRGVRDPSGEPTGRTRATPGVDLGADVIPIRRSNA
jgi:hypothetical protein